MVRIQTTKQVSAVPNVSTYPPICFLASPTCTHTYQAENVGRVGQFCRFQSLVLVFGFSYLWLHLDLLLLIPKHWLWYVIVFFWCIGCPYCPRTNRHTICPILNITCNTLSTIVGPALWVVWVAIGCWHSLIGYRLPLLATQKATCFLPYSENEC